MRLEGTVAIVTGGGSGLGAATARRLAAGGARVAVLDLNASAAEKVAGEIGGFAARCDVADPDAAVAAIVEVKQKLGAPRILASIAGIGTAKRIVGREGPQPLEDFARVVRVNLIGSFNMLRLSAAAMSALDPLDEGERGVIVNTASIAAYEGQVGQAAYAASKGGVVGMTLPAARELARAGVRVMTIAPGLFHTPMVAGLPPEVQQSLAASVPYPPRLGLPEEFAALVEHIATNRFLNGEVIRLDGALRMAPR
jgi:NAD(P)-dependent dehydrogenase (short-subunit alcohol dehydrogenase family)